MKYYSNDAFTILSSPVHTSCECECEANWREFDVTTLFSHRYSQVSSASELNCCDLFVVNLWRQHSYRIRRKYEPGFSQWLLRETKVTVRQILFRRFHLSVSPVCPSHLSGILFFPLPALYILLLKTFYINVLFMLIWLLPHAQNTCVKVQGLSWVFHSDHCLLHDEVL